jgi:hypothetical protein
MEFISAQVDFSKMRVVMFASGQVPTSILVWWGKITF